MFERKCVWTILKALFDGKVEADGIHDLSQMIHKVCYFKTASVPPYYLDNSIANQNPGFIIYSIRQMFLS